MSFLKGLFFDEEPKAAETAPAEPAAVVESPTEPSVASHVPNTESRPGSYNQEMFDKLDAALESNNMKEYCYLDLKNALEQEHVQNIPTEKAKYETVYGMAKSMVNADISNIVKSVGFYRDILNTESSKFEGEIASKVSNEIEPLEVEIQENTATIEELTQLIEESRLKIQQLNETNVTLKSDVDTKRVDVATIEASFNMTLKRVHEVINEDETKIMQYLAPSEVV